MLSLVSRTSETRLEKPLEVFRREATRLPWAWDGLSFAVPMHETSNEGLRDVVNNVLPTSNTMTWTRDNRGNPALQDTGAPGFYVQYPDTPAHDKPSTELTAYCRFKNRGLAGVECGLLCNPYSAGTPWVTWSLQSAPSGGNNLYGAMAVGVTSVTVGDTSAMPTTEYVSGFLRWRSGSAPRIDFLGERGNIVSSVTGTTTSGSLGYNAGMGIRINSTEAPSTANFHAYYSQALVWSRRLTDVEMMSIVADPFGWYSPRRETVLLAGPFPVFPPPASVASVSGTSPYSGASIAPTFGAAGIVTAYTVTAGANQSADFTRTVAGSTTTDTVAAGDTQVFPTGAASAADVTYVELDSGDTGV